MALTDRLIASTTTRMLAAALAVAALGAPAAQAQPADPHAPATVATDNEPARHDPRSPDARNAAHNPRGTVDATANAIEQDLRHLRAGGDIAQRPLAGPPTWPANPQPVAAAPAAETPDSAGGIDWTAIALGTAGSLIAVGLAGVAVSRRRTPRRRAAA